jgi:hypothetical protein
MGISLEKLHRLRRDQEDGVKKLRKAEKKLDSLTEGGSYGEIQLAERKVNAQREALSEIERAMISSWA